MSEEGDPSQDPENLGRPLQGVGKRGEGVQGTGNAATGLTEETQSGVGPSKIGGKSGDEEGVETGAAGVIGGVVSSGSSLTRDYIDDAPVTFPDPSDPIDVPVEESLPLSEDALFGGSADDVVDLPEIDLVELNEAEFDPDAVTLTAQPIDPIDILRGAWLQVCGTTDSDFALGGTRHRVLAIDTVEKGIECFCFFGESPRETHYGRVGFEPIDDSFAFELQKDPDLDRAFDSGVTQSLMGHEIIQPVSVEGDVIEFQGVEGGAGNLIQIGGRIYQRIDSETFEGLRAGSLPLPAPSSSGTGGDGQSDNVKQRFFGIEATGRRICFICDGSGSMTAHFDRLQKELVSLVRALPGTEFVVMYFSGKTIGDLSWRPGGPKGASWLQIKIGTMSSGGGSDPNSAFEIALSGKQLSKRPDTIFLMTDGMINPSVIDLLSRLNGPSSSRSRIHTLGFGSVGNSGQALLKEIANVHGGQYRIVGP